eukprot:757314-Hanusia_phi.AAC.1
MLPGSAELVVEDALISCRSRQVKARENSDFRSFVPMLKEMFDLRKVKRLLASLFVASQPVRQEILTLTKPDMSLYDAAVDSFDPRMKVASAPSLPVSLICAASYKSP